MKLLAWKGEYVVDGTNSRMRRIVEQDFEQERRQKRISEMQRIDIAVALVWITACLFGVTVLVEVGTWAVRLFNYVEGAIR